MAQALCENAIFYLECRVQGQRESRLVRTLGAVYPGHVSAKQLMIRSGLAFHSNPVSAFVELCNSFIRINRDLSRHGWQAIRSGGTPDDQYWLRPSGGG